MSSTNNRPRSMAPAAQQDQISRLLLVWLNQFPDKPVERIHYEFLTPGSPGMSLSTIQGAYKTKQYILGGYEARYEFKVVYRVQPGDSDDRRLKADELLNRLGDWATGRANMPALGAGVRGLRIEANTRASAFARFENGDEDHQIFMTMTYEVI